MVHCHTPTSLRTGRAGFAPLLAAALLVLLFAGMQQTGAFPSWRLEVGSDRFKTCSPSPTCCLVCKKNTRTF